MRFLLISVVLLITPIEVFGQEDLQKTLKRLNTESVPYVYVDELTLTKNTVVLDTRQKEEFNISHLPNAIWVGYDAFEIDGLVQKIPDKNTPLIVYCSIGVRSEDIGELALKGGYSNVKNLYGGIFEWKNQNKMLHNLKGTPTDSVHTYSKEWRKLLKKGIPIYEKH